MAEPDLASADPYAQLSLDTTKQQIRLLKVIRNDSEKVECTLEVFDLDAAPAYTALSYRWGSPLTKHAISINGYSSLVSHNLCLFLETYRHEECDEYLWIDHVCIAQSNLEKRNHQVALMSQIYSRCQSTIVWLYDKRDRYPAIAEEFNRTHTKAALLGFLDDSYFKRLWIVQEIVLAAEIWVFTPGNLWIPWQALQECFISKAWGPEHRVLRDLVRSAMRRQEKPLTLKTCILNFAGQDCEDPRDRLYGVVGMMQERRHFVVDYAKSIDQVFVDAVLAFTWLDTHKRQICVKHMAEVLGISKSKSEHLIALLDLVKPICSRQMSVLRNSSPATPADFGMVSWIGLAFAEASWSSRFPYPGKKH